GYDAAPSGTPTTAQLCAAVHGQYSIGLSNGAGVTPTKKHTAALDQFSVEAWIKTSTLGLQSIFSRDIWNYDWGIGLFVADGSGQISFGHYGGSIVTTSGVDVHNNQWHHVVGTVTPDGLGAYTYMVYVDGVLKGAKYEQAIAMTQASIGQGQIQI